MTSGVADELVAARLERRFVAAPSAGNERFTLEDGYALGDRVAALWSAAGHTAVGIKLGLTYRPKWNAIGITAPVWAPIYADGVHENRTFDLSPLLAPRLEAEVIVELSRELHPGAGGDRRGHWLRGAGLRGCRLPLPGLVADPSRPVG
jgi:2-oxo-3-hexenedioate decarboxylase